MFRNHVQTIKNYNGFLNYKAAQLEARAEQLQLQAARLESKIQLRNEINLNLSRAGLTQAVSAPEKTIEDRELKRLQKAIHSIRSRINTIKEDAALLAAGDTSIELHRQAELRKEDAQHEALSALQNVALNMPGSSNYDSKTYNEIILAAADILASTQVPSLDREPFIVENIYLHLLEWGDQAQREAASIGLKKKIHDHIAALREKKSPIIPYLLWLAERTKPATFQRFVSQEIENFDFTNQDLSSNDLVWMVNIGARLRFDTIAPELLSLLNPYQLDHALATLNGNAIVHVSNGHEENDGTTQRLNTALLHLICQTDVNEEEVINKIKLFLLHGASLSANNTEGQSASALLVERYPQVVMWLLSQIDKCAALAEDCTALHQLGAAVLAKSDVRSALFFFDRALEPALRTNNEALIEELKSDIKPLLNRDDNSDMSLYMREKLESVTAVFYKRKIFREGLRRKILAASQLKKLANNGEIAAKIALAECYMAKIMPEISLSKQDKKGLKQLSELAPSNRYAEWLLLVKQADDFAHAKKENDHAQKREASLVAALELICSRHIESTEIVSYIDKCKKNEGLSDSLRQFAAFIMAVINHNETEIFSMLSLPGLETRVEQINAIIKSSPFISSAIKGAVEAAAMEVKCKGLMDKYTRNVTVPERPARSFSTADIALLDVHTSIANSSINRQQTSQEVDGSEVEATVSLERQPSLYPDVVERQPPMTMQSRLYPLFAIEPQPLSASLRVADEESELQCTQPDTVVGEEKVSEQAASQPREEDAGLKEKQALCDSNYYPLLGDEKSREQLTQLSTVNNSEFRKEVKTLREAQSARVLGQAGHFSLRQQQQTMVSSDVDLSSMPDVPTDEPGMTAASSRRAVNV